MNNKPTVTVIMPLFMMEYRLKKAFSSLKNQTFQDFELIVVDDASPDASVAIACKLMEEFTDARLITHKSRAGLWEARKAGIMAANGKYILFLDPREWLDSDALQRLTESIGESGVDLIQMRRKRFVRRVAVKSENSATVDYNRKIDGEEFRILSSRIRINGEISPYCGDKLYRRQLLIEACSGDFNGNWGEVQILNINYLRHARSLMFIDYAGVNVPWSDDFSNYKFSRLNDFKNLYILKKILGEDLDMLKEELRRNLRYHIRQLLSELAWTPEAVARFMNDELNDPIWKEVGEFFNLEEIIAAEYSNIRNSTLKTVVTKFIE